MQHTPGLKAALKRGALVAAANWPLVLVGFVLSAEMIEVMISVGPPRRSSVSGVSRSRATRNAPPAIGTARSSFTLESAMKPTMTSGQLTAATSAPRFSAAFSPGVCCMAKHTTIHRVSCE